METYNPQGFQSIYNDPNLQSAKATATQAQQTALAGQVAQQTLPDMLRSALTAKFSADNPLIQDIQGAREGAMNSFTSAPLSVLPENNNGMIFNPNQQADLIQRQRSAKVAELSTLNDLFGLNVGGIQNVIDSTGRAFGAQVTGQQGAATIAQNNLAQLLQELQLKQQEYESYKNQLLQLAQLNFQKQQAQKAEEAQKRAEQVEQQKLAEEIRQFNESLSLEKTKVNASSGGGKDAALLALLMGGGTTGSGQTSSTSKIDPSKFIVPDKKTTAQQNLLKGANLSSFSGNQLLGNTSTPAPAKAQQPSLTGYKTWGELGL